MIHVEQHGPVTAIRMARSLLGRPLYWTAAYWVDGLLVDAGPPCTAAELVRALDSLPVNQVAITHGHEDHIGGLARIRERYADIPIYVARRTQPYVEEPDRLGMHFYRRLVWGQPRPVTNLTVLDEVDDVVRTPNYTLRVVETPGHSPDHVSFYESTHRWLFCGDAFVGGLDRSWTREFDLFGVISSLHTLDSLRPERLFPGSGTVRRTPRPEIHEKIAYLTRLSAEVAKLDAAGFTLADMVASLFQRESSMRFWTAGHYSAANLVEACRSYNALVAPAQPMPGAAPEPRPGQGSTADRTDPSARKSPDQGDRIR